jgi:hypothetical protein
MIDLKLSKLSVLLRVAEAYAMGNTSGVESVTRELHPSGKYPLVISAEYPLPLHLFSPRLSAMLTKNEEHLDANAIWDTITARENIIRMISASELERTAAESLGKQFEERYPLDKDEFFVKRKQMMGYMIKVVMESFGLLVFNSRMMVSTVREGADPRKRKSNYFSTATRYAPMTSKDRNAFIKLIEDENTRAVFKSITDLILDGKTEYQRLYNVSGLSMWNSL